jgi:nucleotide-binding universal stress UspA family protein
MYRHLLIPTDGSTLSLKAARAGAKLAKALGARVTVLYVTPHYTPPYMGEEAIVFSAAYTQKDFQAVMKRNADEAIAAAKAAAKALVPMEAATVAHRTPWEGIIKASKDLKCDLIVMASHGRRGIAGLLLGSETTKVLTHSKTPVLVCR